MKFHLSTSILTIVFINLFIGCGHMDYGTSSKSAAIPEVNLTALCSINLNGFDLGRFLPLDFQAPADCGLIFPKIHGYNRGSGRNVHTDDGLGTIAITGGSPFKELSHAEAALNKVIAKCKQSIKKPIYRGIEVKDYEGNLYYIANITSCSKDDPWYYGFNGN